MKFGKEFKSQMVPEWQEAYMNYDSLKSILKGIHGFKLEHKRLNTPSGLRRQMTMYRPFSGLLVRNHSTAATTKTASSSGGGLGSGKHYGNRHDIEEQAILETRSKEEDRYETKFLMTSDLGGEYELVFFRRLDDEFNKVNKFYKDKVEEVMKEAALLNRQMDALIAFRVKVDNPDEMSSESWSVEMNRLASDVAAAAAADAAAAVTVSSALGPARTTRRSSSTSSFVLRDGRVHMDVVSEIEQSSEGRSENLGNDTGVNGSRAIKRTSSTNTVQGINPNNFKAARPSPLEILDHVKISNTLETPRSTIKGILNINQDQESSFGKQNLTKVEKQLHSAFIEFYQKLRLVKSYSFLNILAFSKIMKKYDKITSRKASKHYLNMVDKSYLGSSNKITRLMDRVEATFIKHFANANRSKGIYLLRPKAKKERHSISFSSGVLSGCTISLIIALILIVRARNIIGKEGSSHYMVTMFPLYSLFGFTVLHMLMYAMNLYAWRHYRVNYPFIFGFKQGTELGYREVFLLSMGLATLALASVLANLDMEMDVNTKDYKTLTELLPLGLVTLVVLVICCPFNIIYRSSRYFLLRSAFHCICSPLYRVTLPDFLLADQLTSQVQAIRSLEFYICYYGWGDFRHRQNTCQKSDVYSIFYFIMGTIPYWTRLLQCLRRFYDEKDPMQGYNGLKYFSTIVAVLMRTAYTRREARGWWIMAWISSAIAAIVSTWWDIVIDWGLLQKNSKNRWLRDKLLVSRKRIYFGAMVLNVLLRFAWLQTMLNFQVSFLHKEALTAIVASLEIIRRGIWNFFRLENEHLNNVGKYRAFKSVPLPFSYDEDEHKDD